MFKVMLVYLVNIVVIAILSSFAAFYFYKSIFLKYLNLVISGILLAFFTCIINHQMLSIQLGKNLFLQDRAGHQWLTYFAILVFGIVLEIWIGDLKVKQESSSPFFAINTQLIPLGLILVVLLLMHYMGRYKYKIKDKIEVGATDDINRLNPSLNAIVNEDGDKKVQPIILRTSPLKIIITHLMVVFPYVQLMVSILYGEWFANLESEGKYGIIVIVCSSYPITMGLLKSLAEKLADSVQLKMKFYIEYLGIAFASLPYRTLFFQIPQLNLLFYLVIIKSAYKILLYIILAGNLHSFIKCIKRTHKKLEKKAILSQAF